MERVNSLLDTNMFNKLDIRKVHGNLRGAKGKEEKLGFIGQAGKYFCLAMSFGPTRAPKDPQYFPHDILLGRIGKDVATYLAEIMTYTKKSLHKKQHCQYYTLSRW